MTIPVLRSRTALLVAGAILATACSGGSTPFESTDSSPASTETAVIDDEPAVSAPVDSEPVATDAPVETARCGDPDGAEAFIDVDCGQTHIAEFAGTVALPADSDASLEPADDPALHRACMGEISAVLGDHPGGNYLDAEFVVDEAIGTVDCWIVNSANILTGSIAEIGLAAAVGDLEFVDTLAVGSCFQFVGDQFSFVEPVACSLAPGDVEIKQQLGVAELPEGQYPGDDAIGDLAIDACLALIELTAYGVEIAPTFSVLTPGVIGWTEYGQRSITCVGEDLGTLGDVPSTEDGASSPCAGLADDDFTRVDCDQPHASELAGFADLSTNVLPDDAVEASDVLMAACRPVVETFIGQSMSLPGFAVGFSSDTGPGEAVSNPIECFVTTGSSEALVGSIAELGARAALNGLVLVREMNPADCFLLDDQNFSLGQPVDCGTPDALVHIGSFELDEGPHLGDDVIRGIRFERCSALLAGSGISADPASVSGTFPNEEVWRRFDRRAVTCDATPQ